MGLSGLLRLAIHNGLLSHCLPSLLHMYVLIAAKQQGCCVALSGNNNSATLGSYSMRDVYPTSPCVLPPSTAWCEIPVEEPERSKAGLTFPGRAWQIWSLLRFEVKLFYSSEFPKLTESKNHEHFLPLKPRNYFESAARQRQ